MAPKPDLIVAIDFGMCCTSNASFSSSPSATSYMAIISLMLVPAGFYQLTTTCIRYRGCVRCFP